MHTDSRRRAFKLSYFPEHQRGIFRAEGNAIADGMFDNRLAARLRNVVEITFRVGRVQVNGRGDLAMLHGHESGGYARGAAGTLRMVDLGFARRTRGCGRAPRP